MNKYEYTVRLADGREMYVTENPLTACRELLQVLGKGQEAYLVSPSRAASMYLYTTIRQNMSYIYVMAQRAKVEVHTCEEAVVLVVKAARLDDYEPFALGRRVLA